MARDRPERTVTYPESTKDLEAIETTPPEQPVGSGVVKNPPMLKTRDRIDQLIREHSDFAARTLRMFGLSASDTDDGLQEVFLVLAKRLDDIRQGAEKAFVFRVAQHVAFRMNESRLRKRENVMEEPPERETGASPEVILGNREALNLMRDVLQALPDNIREVFVLFEVEELSSVQIAEMLDIPRGTVVSRLKRARELVEERMRKRGYLYGGRA